MSKYAIIKLNNEEYLIDISLIKEIIFHKECNFFPNNKKYIEGIINLRNEIFSIVKLTELLKIESSIDNKKIIILNDSNKIGLSINDVSEIIELDEEMNSNNYDNVFINGVFNKDNRVFIRLNIDEIIKSV